MKINYPIKFEPILKEKIWGGAKLSKLLNKDSDKENIGESWEISDFEEDISLVSNGFLKGRSLHDLVSEYKDELVGEKVYQQFGDQFPLLIKYIDAKDVLSIQLHPNDELAKKRHNSFGKTEMWYVMQADKGGELLVGFKEEVSKEEYLLHLKNNTLVDILNKDEVDKGDVYFISTGLVHAIGAGVLLAEIQQTSDLTYRIYDYHRKDDQGNYRDLHTEEAMDAIDFSVKNNYRSSYIKKINDIVNAVDCKYFTTNFISVNDALDIDNSDKDSFVIYMCVGGNGVRLVGEDFSENLDYGETILVPAKVNRLGIESNEYSELLEIYIS